MSDGGPGDPFANRGRGIREVLQAVEDMLVDAGYDDFLVATQSGIFHWKKVPSDHHDEGSAPEG